MKTPTIVEIKQATRKNAPHFFDRATLKFFGQTMHSFKVIRSPGGRVFVFAPRYDDVRLMGYTFREYVEGDLLMPRNDNGTLADDDTLEQVLDYIRTH